MAWPDDFDEGPPTALDEHGAIPRALSEASTGPSVDERRNAWWNAGREVGRADGRNEVLEALEVELLRSGVPGPEIPAILERVRARAEGRVISGR